MKRVIIAGGRDFNDYSLLYNKVRDVLHRHSFYYVNLSKTVFEYDNIIIVSGTANGADKLGERFAKEHGILIEKYPANWDEHGKSAGYKRNVEMAKSADILIAFWDGKSKGTKHMIDIGLDTGLEVHVFRYERK